MGDPLRKTGELHYQCLTAIDLIFEENNPAGVKAFLYQMGLIKNILRLPITPLSSVVHQKIIDYLSR